MIEAALGCGLSALGDGGARRSSCLQEDVPHAEAFLQSPEPRAESCLLASRALKAAVPRSPIPPTLELQ
jgi:hypothetical protein